MTASNNFTQAATQGSLGNTSSGSVSISITKMPSAQVTRLVPESWEANSNSQLTSDVCVYSSTGDYRITATGEGQDKNFVLKSGDQNIGYNVNWKLPNHESQQLQAGKSSSFNSLACDSGKNAKLSVNINQADISRDKSYTGTLTLLVSPY